MDLVENAAAESKRNTSVPNKKKEMRRPVLETRAVRIAKGRPQAQTPRIARLSEVLTEILTKKSAPGQVKILARQANDKASTFPTEVVTCLMPDGRELQVFCKYSGGRTHKAYGHRGNVAYEAEVYRRALFATDRTYPAHIGSHLDAATGETWLFLEYLGTAEPINEPKDVIQAARWIAEFHRDHASRVDEYRQLIRYDRPYYSGWVRRTYLFSEGLDDKFRWLSEIRSAAEGFIDQLLNAPRALIHGEYYRNNILNVGGKIHPIDWESAALAPGEIDLATLTQGWWPEEIIGECEREYARVRWPQGPPPEYCQNLAAARLYCSFRWLGQNRAWTQHESSAKMFHFLRGAVDEWRSVKSAC